MWSFPSGRWSGGKKGRPCTWFQCRWLTNAVAVKFMGAAAHTWRPQKRRPVPRSRTIGSNPSPVTTTHTVLPPMRWFDSHEHGVEPRTP